MPELPDIELYRTLLHSRLVSRELASVSIYSPFVVRSVTPPVKDLVGHLVTDVRRIGKRVVLCFSDEQFLIVHLMIAGRFRWQDQPDAPKLGGKIALASFSFGNGILTLTEAGSKKRASITAVRGEDQLAAHDPGGLDVFSCTPEAFARSLRSQNLSVKDSLTNPHLFSGIGNAYSDEILHAARLSPLKRTQKLTDSEVFRLHECTKSLLMKWTQKLLTEFADRFPGTGDVTAFRPDFAVHGRFGKPCPVCQKPVQRICYADNESNYCAECQNEGRILADRALSRLLKDDYPRSL